MEVKQSKANDVCDRRPLTEPVAVALSDNDPVDMFWACGFALRSLDSDSNAMVLARFPIRRMCRATVHSCRVLTASWQ
jgi:hypothetical protein